MYRITCRARDRGRGLAQVRPVAGSPDPAHAGLDRWTIFVHGFNNSTKDAAATWKNTTRQLESRGIDSTRVVHFYWPGDYSRWRIFSAMNYPRCVPIAESAAGHLADYLGRVAAERRTPLKLSFIAHSLGALVVLETVRLLRKRPANVLIHDVLLMAAAVPEGFCLPAEAYGRRFSTHTAEVALYSLDDLVLRFFFRVGQRIAHRFPPDRRRAVGRTGGPGAGDGQRWTSNVHLDRFGHGDYWSRSASIEHIARVIKPRTGPPAAPTRPPETPGRIDTVREDTLPWDEAPGGPPGF